MTTMTTITGPIRPRMTPLEAGAFAEQRAYLAGQGTTGRLREAVGAVLDTSNLAAELASLDGHGPDRAPEYRDKARALRRRLLRTKP
jgi:hypothetical protein